MKKTLKDFIWFLLRNAAMTKRQDGKFILRQEKRMAAKISLTFAKQQDFLVKKLKALPGLNGVNTNTINDDIENILDSIPGQNELVENIVFYSESTMLKGGVRSIKDLSLKKFGISFTVKHPEAIKYFNAKRKLQLSNASGTITATTKDRIKEIISEGIKKGSSYEDVARQIRAQSDAGVFSRARAQMISTNEAGHAYEQGRKYPINDFIKDNQDRRVEKTWITVGDAKVTPEHTDNEKEGWIAYDDTFSGTGDSEPPADDNPRCRCTIEYRIV